MTNDVTDLEFDSATSGAPHRASRRRILAAAALATGGATLSALRDPAPAAAAHITSLDGFDGFYNVLHLDFGDAYNDGDSTKATQTTAAIQDCINQAAADNRTVYFPPGTYPINGPLTLKANSVLIGHGPRSVIRVVDDALLPAHLLSNDPPTLSVPIPEPPTGLRIENLTLDGNDRVKGSLILIGSTSPTTPGTNVYIRHLECKKNRYVDPAPLATTGADQIIRIVDCQIGAVENCYIHDGVKDGIKLERCQHFIINGNIVDDCGDDHIGVGAGSHASVSDNIVNARKARGGAAIYIASSNSVVVGNVCYGGVRAGIEVRTDCQDLLLADNVIVQSGLSDLTYGWPNRVVGWGQGRGAGISVLNVTLSSGVVGPIKRLRIKDNAIYAPKNHGISIAASQGVVTDLEITGNVISWEAGFTEPPASPATAPCGIAVIGDIVDGPPLRSVDNVRVCGNDIRRSKGAGVLGRGNTAISLTLKRWDIRDNSILDAGTGASGAQPGIHLERVDKFMVMGNRVQDTRDSGSKTQKPGLKLTATSGKSLVLGNDLSGNADNLAISEPTPTNPDIVFNDNLEGA